MKLKNMKTFEQHSSELNISGVMNSKIKINENVDENIKVIEDSYNDYISVDDKYKEALARQIALTAKGHIKYRESNLEDWLRVFADEDIVISKLKAL
jgi:bacillopeptidase F (M6 metalloprotease family)